MVNYYKTDKIQPKQEKFIQNLLKGMSQRQAYIEAGYKSDGVRPEQLDSRAYNLAHKPKIEARLLELQAEIREREKSELIYSRDEARRDARWLLQKSKEQIEAQGIKQATAQAFLNSQEVLIKLDLTEEEVEEIADDGFIKALAAESEDLWQDE